MSRRGRIPIALVAVLVLVGAVLLAGHAGFDDGEPEANVDSALAVERTDAVTQTAVREGVQAATERAAAQPLTRPNESNPYGSVLAAEGDTYRSYLKALIYQEVRDRFGSVGQSVDGVRTTVSLPPIENRSQFRDAIERVAIERNPDHSEGVLGVTITDIEVTAERNGERIVHRENESVTVSVASPVLDLHERTTDYENLLNAGITEPGSFTQRFNARTYGIGYLRGWAQNYQQPVVDVIANRHVEPSANSAAYRIQRDVFGSADPSLKGAVQAGWACMLVQDGEAFMGESEYSLGTRVPSTLDVSAEQLCNVTDFVLDPTVELPDGSDVVQETLPGMDHEHEVSVGNRAYIPLTSMADPRNEHSFVGILQRMFEVSVSTETDRTVLTSPEWEHDCDPFGPSLEREQVSGTAFHELDSHRIDGGNATIYQFEIQVGTTVREECDESDVKDGIKVEAADRSDEEALLVELTTTIRVDETNPDALIDSEYEYETARTFEPSPERRENQPYYEHDARDTVVPDGYENYGGRVQDHLVRDLFRSEVVESGSNTGNPFVFPPCARSDSAERLYRCWVVQHLKYQNRSEYNLDLNETSAATYPVHGIREASDVGVDDVNGEDVTVDPRAIFEDVDELLSTMYDDIRAIRNEMAAINHTFERGSLLETGQESPFEGLSDQVASAKENYTRLKTLGGQPAYVDVGEKLILETRYTYFSLLEKQIEWIGSIHSDAVDSLDDKIEDALPDGLEAMDYLRRGTDDPEPADTDIPSPSPTGPVTYEVSGSPTYLESANLTKNDVTAIDSEVEKFAPLAMRNRNFVDLPYEDIVDGLWQKLAEALPLMDSEPDAELSFRMSSDVLLAAELAQGANNSDEYLADQWGDSETEFEDDVANLRENIDAGLTDYEREAANQIVMQLYDEEVAKCAIHSPDGFLEHLRVNGEKTLVATLGAVETIQKDPTTLFTMGSKAVVSELLSLDDVASKVLDVAEEILFGDDEETVKDKAKELGSDFEDAGQENVEEAPFDPTKSEYEYGDCTRALEFLADIDGDDEDATERILDTRDRIEGAINDSLEDYRRTHGLARTAEAVGKGNLAEAMLDRILAELDGPAAHMPEAWVEQNDGSITDEEWNRTIRSAVVPGLQRGANLKVDIGGAEMAERLDENIQAGLENVSAEVVEARLGDLGENVSRLGGEKLAEMEEWVGGKLDEYDRQVRPRHARAARVPAGIPLLPLPGMWYATVNAWDIDVAGQYARFEVTGNMGTPEDATSLTYVREQQPVTLEINGTKEHVGAVEPIAFEGRSILLVVVPPGVGVGDRNEVNPECSPTYPETGVVDDEAIAC